MTDHRTSWRELGRGWRGLVLESPSVELTLLPDKGCDLYSWVDRRSGTDVLFKPPWGLPATAPVTADAESTAAWLERYPGGWQVLCPNGGAAADGWGFHGEACLVPWDVADVGQDDESAWVELGTRLYRAPLILKRRIVLRGDTFTLHESVTNTSPEPLEFMWSHHPAFGAPFLERGCTVATGARTVVADDEAPGTMLAPASRHAWPMATTPGGAELDLSAVPDPTEARSHFAYLTDFDDGWFTIVNPRLRLAVELRWPTEVFPYAWFWQEIHSTPGQPWWREAYVCAVEPASTYPGQGVAAARAKGADLVHLAGRQERSVELVATLRSTEEVTG